VQSDLTGYASGMHIYLETMIEPDHRLSAKFVLSKEVRDSDDKLSAALILEAGDIRRS